MATRVDDAVDLEVRALCLDVTVRDIDQDNRTATFVAATEGGVDTWAGTEHLQMAGVDLRRYRRNPVVLDTHNRYEAGAVIGKARAKREDRTLVAEITFAETQRADDIWELVRTGFLKALSVGFLPREVKSVDAGETFRLGEAEIEGPARIVRKWELYEISVVPVPADADALRRSFVQGAPVELAASVRSLIGICERLLNTKETEMPKDNQTVASTPTPDNQPAAPNPSSTTAREQPKIETPAVQPSATELLVRDIRAICPPGLEAVADTCILENLDLETARKRMLEANAERTKPVGTPPTDDAGGEAGGETAERKLEDVPDGELVRSLGG